jgi:hypothetical protein
MEYDISIEAKKLLNGVKMGMPFSSLTDDEKIIIRKIYGPKWFETVGLTSEDQAE